MVSPYAAAGEAKLEEILRLAEARLNAQLTLAIAADQRAMTCASFLAAIDAALIAAAATASGHPALLTMAVGFGLSTLAAVWGAQPVAWDPPGYRPGLWLKDIATGDTLHGGRAVMAEHYDERIRDNDGVMAANGNWLRVSLGLAVLTLCLGGVAALLWG